MIFDYHGYRAALNDHGGIPTPEDPAVGLEDLNYAKVTHAGVPLHHSGIHLTDMVNNGQKIVRTMNEKFNLYPTANYPVWNLGKILMDFKNDKDVSVSGLGQFFYDFVNEVQTPCDGLANDFERSPLNKTAYPITSYDSQLSYVWGYYNLNVNSTLIEYRCKQFAVIFRIMIHLLKKFKFPNCETNIAYSGYNGLLYSGEDIKTRYGCDFQKLTIPTSWRVALLPSISHVQCAWHTTINLPAQAISNLPNVPTLHTICLSPGLNVNDENWEGSIQNRLSILRSGDGLGMVEYGYPNYPTYYWNAENSRICSLVAKYV